MPLLPGTALEARLPSTGGAWRLPQAAVTRQGSQAYVFVRSRDGFTARPVTVSVAAGDQVRVEGSLQAGDQVAVSNIIALKGVWLGDSGMEEE
jgi:multidrug efflux pump subunit AcrA (membrane-fusion protein)